MSHKKFKDLLTTHRERLLTAIRDVQDSYAPDHPPHEVIEVIEQLQDIIIQNDEDEKNVKIK